METLQIKEHILIIYFYFNWHSFACILTLVAQYSRRTLKEISFYVLEK